MEISKNTAYKKLKRPSSSHSSIWSHFGFQTNLAGTIISRKNILCCLCFAEFPYSKDDTSELTLHMEQKHPPSSKSTRKTRNTTTKPAPISDPDTADDFDMASEIEIYDEVEDDQIEYLIENVMEVEVDDEEVKPEGLTSIKAYDEELAEEDLDIAQCLAELCVEDLLSPAIVDGSGFIGLVQKLKPDAVVPESDVVNIR